VLLNQNRTPSPAKQSSTKALIITTKHISRKNHSLTIEMYPRTSAFLLALFALHASTVSVPTTSSAYYTDIDPSSHDSFPTRGLEGLEISYLNDDSALQKRTWPLWGHSGGKGCSGSGSGSGNGSGSAGAGAGAGGSGKGASSDTHIISNELQCLEEERA
jgi:hypothetical protein